MDGGKQNYLIMVYHMQFIVNLLDPPMPGRSI